MSLSGSIIGEIYFYISNIIYGTYNRLWLALILFVTLKVEELRYLLPADIIFGFKKHIKVIVLLALSVTIFIDLIGEFINLIVGLLSENNDYYWIFEVVRYLLWPIFFVFYSFCIMNVYLGEKDFKANIFNSISKLKSFNLTTIVVIILLYSASQYISQNIISGISTSFLNEYLTSSGRIFDQIIQTLVQIQRLVIAVFEVIFLTIFSGSIVYLFIRI